MFHAALLKNELSNYTKGINSWIFCSTIKGFVAQDRAKISRDQYICMEDGLSDVLFFGSFPKKNARIFDADHESHKNRI